MQFITVQHEKGVNHLQSLGIKTLADLDAYRQQHDPCNSRFAILKGLVGFDAAMWILNDLALSEAKTA